MKRYLLATFVVLLTAQWAAGYDFAKGGLLYHITDSAKRTVEVTHWDLVTGMDGIPTHPRPDQCTAHRHDSTHVHGPHCHHAEEEEYEPVIPDFPDKIVVPARVWHKGKRYTVTAIGDGSFYRRENIQSVRLPKTVTRIGRSAFSGCRNLRKVEWHPHLESIEGYAFYLAASLERVVLPENLKHLGKYAFAVCEQLQYVEMPACLSFFHGNAFLHSRRLKRVVLRQTTPPTVKNSGNGTDLMNIRFEVPEEALSAYEKDKFWRKQQVVAQ